MRDKGSPHFPESRFITIGVAEGNKSGKEGIVTASIPK